MLYLIKPKLPPALKHGNKFAFGQAKTIRILSQHDAHVMLCSNFKDAIVIAF